MTKRHTEKELPLNLFLQSEKYFLLKHELNKDLNYNSQMVNTEVDHFGNLKPDYIHTFTKSKDEKKAIKKAKKEYKEYKNTLHGDTLRKEVVVAFIELAKKGYPRSWAPDFTVVD